MNPFFRPSLVPGCVLATVVAVLAVGRPASAVLIKAGPTRVFSDNFEDDTVASPPGGWLIAPSAFTVRDDVVPGPADGENYVRAFRSGASGGVLIADFGAVTSGTVSVELKVFIPAGAADSVLQMSLGPVLEADLAAIFTAPVWLDNSGNSVFTYVAPGGDASHFDTGVPIIKGTWQQWLVEYTFVAGSNNDTFTIAVDGITSAPINAGGYANVADPANLRYLSFRVGAAGTYFIDAVPEPATGALIAVGWVASLARRRAR